MDLGAVVVDAEADHRPAVVLALLAECSPRRRRAGRARAPIACRSWDAAPRPANCGDRSSRFQAWRRRGRRTGCPWAPSRRARCERSCRCGCRGSAPRADRSRGRPWSGTGCCPASARYGSRNGGRSTAGHPAEDHLHIVELAVAKRRARHRGARAAARPARRSRNRSSCSARSCGRARRRAGRPGRMQKTFGTPCSGADSLPSGVAIRMRPGRSVTSMRPSGRKASAQGCDSPPATVSTLRSPAEDLNVCALAAGDSASKPAASAIDKRMLQLREAPTAMREPAAVSGYSA